MCIRDYAPGDPTLKLVLYTINAHFSEKKGSCDISQERIAKTSGLGVSTVRAKVSAAARAGWLSLEAHKATGRAWKGYLYRPCIPSGAKLSAEHQKLADKYAATHGEAVLRVEAGTLFPQSGQPRRPPARGGSRDGRPPADGSDDRQLTARRPPADGSDDRQLLGMKGSYASEVEVSEERAGTRVPAPIVEIAIDPRSPEEIEKDRLERELRDRQERERKALAMLREQPETPCENLLKWYGLTPERAADLRNQAIAEGTAGTPA